MKKREAIKKLKISNWLFSYLSTKANFVKDGSGKPHDYNQRELELFKRVIKARKKLMEAINDLKGIRQGNVNE